LAPISVSFFLEALQRSIHHLLPNQDGEFSLPYTLGLINTIQLFFEKYQNYLEGLWAAQDAGSPLQPLSSMQNN
jgi:hypothetical protein